MKSQASSEVERIKEAYGRRKERIKADYYAISHPANQFIVFQREKNILKLLYKHRFNTLSDIKILDVGCGNGGVLREFIKYGAMPYNLYGIDLLPDRIESAKKLSPNIDFKCGNAESLPYDDKFFDIVLCFGVFTSIFEKNMKQNIAREMLRVLNPNGIILWYDYFVSKPTNPDTRGVRRREIKGLFPNCIFDFHRITLAPPITRLLAPHCVIRSKKPLPF
ncbi:MAG: class I SAM-dependent methyltransferase [Thermodesulfovibrionales bacterium]|nr:class I SAM-dependent methyltransferase [Thermodesulfovibrionales bacterium]